MNKKMYALLLAVAWVGYTEPTILGITRFTSPLDYKKSCKNIKWKGSTLKAECQRAERMKVTGQTEKIWKKETQLENASDCKGNIVSSEGSLECIPKGHYQNSCRKIHMKGSTLRARCHKDRKIAELFGFSHKFDEAKYPRTKLKKAWNCKGDISNDNGQLKCSKW